MFVGRLGELHQRQLGSIAPGQARRHRFTATLPDRGAPPSFVTGDNAYIGSALTVRYTWRASAAEPAPPTVVAAAPRVSYRGPQEAAAPWPPRFHRPLRPCQPAHRLGQAAQGAPRA
jgi:hypothetical protein